MRHLPYAAIVLPALSAPAAAIPVCSGGNHEAGKLSKSICTPLRNHSATRHQRLCTHFAVGFGARARNFIPKNRSCTVPTNGIGRLIAAPAGHVRRRQGHSSRPLQNGASRLTAFFPGSDQKS